MKGIFIEGKEEKGAKYAQDLWLLFEYCTDNINQPLHELENLKQFSGLATNYQKLAVLRSGNIATQNVTL